MGFLDSVLGFFGGSGSNIIDSVTDAVDKFVTTDAEKQEMKQEVEQTKEEKEKTEQ